MTLPEPSTDRQYFVFVIGTIALTAIGAICAIATKTSD